VDVNHVHSALEVPQNMPESLSTQTDADKQSRLPPAIRKASDQRLQRST
jgi:hypothetical protein